MRVSMCVLYACMLQGGTDGRPPAGRGENVGALRPKPRPEVSPLDTSPQWRGQPDCKRRCESGWAAAMGTAAPERLRSGHGQPWLTVGFRMIVAGKTGFSGRESSRKPISAVHALISRPGFASRKAQRMCACRTSRTGCRDDVPARRRPLVSFSLTRKPGRPRTWKRPWARGSSAPQPCG